MTRKQKEMLKTRKEKHIYHSCTRKKKYDTEFDALHAGRWVNFYNRTEIGFKPYFCKICQKFHLKSN